MKRIKLKFAIRLSKKLIFLEQTYKGKTDLIVMPLKDLKDLIKQAEKDEDLTIFHEVLK